MNDQPEKQKPLPASLVLDAVQLDLSTARRQRNVIQLLVSQSIPGGVLRVARAALNSMADEAKHRATEDDDELLLHTEVGNLLLRTIERSGGVARFALLASAEERSRWIAGLRVIASSRVARLDEVFPGEASRVGVQ